MIALIGKYKSVLLFILTFLGSYIVLSSVYGFYLDQSQYSNYFPDYLTAQVAEQCRWLLELMGYSVSLIPHGQEPSIKLILENTYLARIVEGCNSASVIILFIAFILSFYNGWKKSALFILFGSMVVYIINLCRIALLSVALYNYPEYSDFLHNIIFPLIIYGTVFVLWFIWIYNFKRR